MTGGRASYYNMNVHPPGVAAATARLLLLAFLALSSPRVVLFDADRGPRVCLFVCTLVALTLKTSPSFQYRFKARHKTKSLNRRVTVVAVAVVTSSRLKVCPILVALRRLVEVRPSLAL